MSKPECLEDTKIPECSKEIVYLQSAFVNFTPRSASQFANYIANDRYFKTEVGKNNLVVEMCYLAYIRVNAIECLQALIYHLNEFHFFTPDFNELILHNTFKFASYQVLLIFAKLNIVTYEEIKVKIISHRRKDFAIFFMPEITIDMMDAWRTPSIFRVFDKKRIHFIRNNYQKLKFLREHGWGEKSIGYVIKNDDVEILAKLSASPYFNFNQFIETSPFEHMRMPRVCTLISLAAFYGSIKCFKLLMLSDAPITENVFCCAIMGGNCPIIHLCSEKVATGGFQAAIEFRRNEVFNWLLTKEQFDAPMLESCLEWENVLVALFAAQSCACNCECIQKEIEEVNMGHSINISHEIIATS